MSGKRDIREYLFVFAQILLFIIYLIPVRWVGISFSSALNGIGIFLICLAAVFIITALIQLNINLSPFPSPVKNTSLITTSIFKISRHPIYAGIIFFCLGYALFSSSIFKMITALAIGFLLYFKSRYEEKLLTDKFPEYEVYRSKVRRFI